MKNLQCKLTRKRWLEIGVSVLLFVLIIAWALVLEYTEPDREATAARKRFFAVARVTDILDDNAETQDWTEGRRIGQQYLAEISKFRDTYPALARMPIENFFVHRIRAHV